MTKIKTSKKVKYKPQAPLCMAVCWIIVTLILIKENAKPRDLIFIPLGAMLLTLVYFKMSAFIKRLERMPQF